MMHVVETTGGKIRDTVVGRLLRWDRCGCAFTSQFSCGAAYDAVHEKHHSSRPRASAFGTAVFSSPPLDGSAAPALDEGRVTRSRERRAVPCHNQPYESIVTRELRLLKRISAQFVRLSKLRPLSSLDQRGT
jgi:hypothetical protein